MGKKIFKRFISSIIICAFVLGTIVVPASDSKAASANLLNTYGALLGRSGTCINSWQLLNHSTTVLRLKMR